MRHSDLNHNITKNMTLDINDKVESPTQETQIRQQEIHALVGCRPVCKCYTEISY